MWGGSKLSEWKDKYGGKALTAGILLVVGVLSYEAGVLKARTVSVPPFVVHEPISIPEARPVEKMKSSENIIPPVKEPTATIAPTTSPGTSENCAYVGSKNSNKYHLPTSRCAKQIKPANLVCFQDKGSAEAKGYLPGCLE